MINDCAYVGETLLKHFPHDIETLHLKRSRGLWDKTFGLSWKVFRASGDIFHAHYLLQDCYLALRLGKRPVVGHAHGSDLRSSLKHRVWGRIVRHNLKNCGRILVSTPDVLAQARAFREDAEYLPNPVDTELFYPKPMAAQREKKRVLIASDSNWVVKGSDIAVKALAKIKEHVDVSIIAYGRDFDKTIALAASLGLRFNVLPKVPHNKLDRYFWDADVVIDRFTLGSLGMISLEAIASGRPVATYVAAEFPQYKHFPFKDVNTADKVANLIEEADAELWKKEYDYLIMEHTPNIIVDKLLGIYDSLEKNR
jgi:glycosyltransferase involved in cell wall biosynthesis